MYAKTALLALIATLACVSADKPSGFLYYDTLFDIIDSDDDGKISSQEANNFYLRIGSKKEHVEEGFKEADLNKDGTIDKQEFKKLAEKVGADLGKVDPVALAFDILDSNDDDQISLDEILKISNILGVSEELVKTQFGKADLDKNGTISREEFKRVLQRPKTNPKIKKA